MTCRDISTLTPCEQYVQLLLELHGYIAAGTGNSEQAEALRDQMDLPWRQLGPREHTLVDGLAADLYTIGETRMSPLKARDDIAERIKEAVQRHDWSGALDLLRENEADLPPAGVAFTRGVCWAHLHQPDVAIIFLQEAARRQPLAPEQEILLLTCMIHAGRVVEAIPRANEIARGEVNPLLLFKAADIFFARACQPQVRDAVAMRRQALELARRALEQTRHLEHDELVGTLRRSALLQLALDHDQLGHTAEAMAACDEALRLNPNDLDANVFRDYLKWVARPEDFRTDFGSRVASRIELPLPAPFSAVGSAT